VKRNRFITHSGGTRSVNRTLEAKARALAGINGYITNLEDMTAEFVIGSYHRLFQIEKSVVSTALPAAQVRALCHQVLKDLDQLYGGPSRCLRDPALYGNHGLP
jgi:hypothetical protein